MVAPKPCFLLPTYGCYSDTCRPTETAHVVLGGQSWPVRCCQKFGNIDTTLSGGSLGSCVDEERSQLREVM
jgi:hypothetical protein